MSRVLIVGDEAIVRSLATALAQDRYEIVHAGSCEQARQVIGSSPLDAILTDDQLRDGSAHEVLAIARGRDVNLSVVLLSARNASEARAESLRDGFTELLASPVDLDLLRTATRRACDRTVILRENARLKEELQRRNGHTDPMSLGWIEALPPSLDMRSFLAAVEKGLIEKTLQATRGAQAEAARRLGLSRSDLSYKLLKYDLRKETSAAS